MRRFAVLMAVLSAACSNPCETSSSEAITYKGGQVDSSGTLYETSPWDGRYLHFPGGRRFQLVHGLGVRPPVVNTYLSFAEYPLGNGNNVSESAGNQAVIEQVTDELIQVRNDTCAEFWLRVTASAPHASSSDAGTD